MADYFNEARESIIDILNGMRASLHSAPTHRHGVDEQLFIASSIERLRVLTRHAFDTGPIFSNIEDLARLREEVVGLKTHQLFAEFGSKRWKPIGPSRNDKGSRYRNRSLTNAQAIDFVLTLLEDFERERNEITSFADPAAMLAAVRLRELVPAQKVAPAQFEFRDEVLRVRHTQAATAKADEGNVAAAKATLAEQGRTILDGLRQSNCDRRLLEQFEALQRKLESDVDIVQLGIANLTCNEMRLEFEQELSSSLSAMLRSHSASISLYVAQFPDWQRFTSNAANVELDEDDIRETKAVAESIADQLSEMPDRVDPEVPRTIRFIANAIANPKQTTKRAAFAVLRTLENLIASTLEFTTNFAGNLLSQTASKTADVTSSILARTVAVVLTSATVLTPVFAKFGDTIWVKSAIELVQKQIHGDTK